MGRLVIGVVAGLVGLASFVPSVAAQAPPPGQDPRDRPRTSSQAPLPDFGAADPLERSAAAAGSVTAVPATNLVDGQVIEVGGTGWKPRASIGLLECDPDLENCMLGAIVRADADGVVADTAFLVRTIIETGFETNDCRVEACVVLAFDYRHPNRTFSTKPIEFDPAGPLLPPPDLRVAPADSVADGDILRLTGGNYYPYASLISALCLPSPQDIRDCDGGGAHYDELHSAEDGTIDEDIVAMARFETDRGQSVDCRVEACSAAIFHFFYGGGFMEGPPLAEAPVAFDPDAPLLAPPAVALSKSINLRERALVRVTGTGFRELTFVEIVSARPTRWTTSRC